jgi:hypothetical protein
MGITRERRRVMIPAEQEVTPRTDLSRSLLRKSSAKSSPNL